MHTCIEDYLRGRVNESFETNEQYKIMAKEIIDKGLNGRLEEIYGIEETAYCPEKYAGTADLLGKMDGVEVCIDFKQSNKPKKRLYSRLFCNLVQYTLSHDVVHGTK